MSVRLPPIVNSGGGSRRARPSSSFRRMEYLSSDTPRSAGYNSARDDRFYTPRAYLTNNSSDEWQTPRGAQGHSSDGEFITPRDDNAPLSSRSHFPAQAYARPSNHAPYISEAKSSHFVPERFEKGYEDQPEQFASPEDIEAIFSYARHGRLDDIDALLEQGIPVDVRDEYGNTLLITASQNGNKRAAKLVLRRGANINARNFKGNTALHYCYHYGYGETLGEYLISKGADSSLRNNSGRLCWEGI